MIPVVKITFFGGWHHTIPNEIPLTWKVYLYLMRFQDSKRHAHYYRSFIRMQAEMHFLRPLFFFHASLIDSNIPKHFTGYSVTMTKKIETILINASASRQMIRVSCSIRNEKSEYHLHELLICLKNEKTSVTAFQTDTLSYWYSIKTTIKRINLNIVHHLCEFETYIEFQLLTLFTPFFLVYNKNLFTLQRNRFNLKKYYFDPGKVIFQEKWYFEIQKLSF